MPTHSLWAESLSMEKGVQEPALSHTMNGSVCSPSKSQDLHPEKSDAVGEGCVHFFPNQHKPHSKHQRTPEGISPETQRATGS